VGRFCRRPQLHDFEIECLAVDSGNRLRSGRPCAEEALMSQARPKLIVFDLSHFCEKARWALDWHGIAYSEISWAPGLHRVLLKRYRANDSTLPVLLDDETIVQGSSAIIDWAESRGQATARSLSPQKKDLAEAQAIERRADEVIGVHVRRLAYAELLPNYPHVAKRELFPPTSGWQGRIGRMMWPAIRRIMMRAYDIRPGAASESRSRLESELDWIDSKLSDRRSYLVGDRFSRVDVTVASLLAPFARPKERYHESTPDAIAADVARWSDRPVMRWVSTQYRDHRLPFHVYQ
jgi:glutathione S-transferase